MNEGRIVQQGSVADLRENRPAISSLNLSRAKEPRSDMKIGCLFLFRFIFFFVLAGQRSRAIGQSLLAPEIPESYVLGELRSAV